MPASFISDGEANISFLFINDFIYDSFVRLWCTISNLFAFNKFPLMLLCLDAFLKCQGHWRSFLSVNTDYRYRSQLNCNRENITYHTSRNKCVWNILHLLCTQDRHALESPWLLFSPSLSPGACSMNGLWITSTASGIGPGDVALHNRSQLKFNPALRAETPTQYTMAHFNIIVRGAIVVSACYRAQ